MKNTYHTLILYTYCSLHSSNLTIQKRTQLFLTCRSLCMIICVSCKRNMSPAHIKTNIVCEIIIYNTHIKFELNQKLRLDTSLLLIICLRRL